MRERRGEGGGEGGGGDGEERKEGLGDTHKVDGGS